MLISVSQSDFHVGTFSSTTGTVTMSNELLIINQTINLESGAGGIDQSFQNIPDDKHACIELFSFRLRQQADDHPDPLVLWAYPANSGPPRRKTLFFPLQKMSPESPFYANTYSLTYRLEPGDAWGVSLYRQDPSVVLELNVYLSGYYYSKMHDRR
ncbi:MAG: hypothetical protein ABW101_06310 [Candidatus Thiodiazotropha sp.]